MVSKRSITVIKSAIYFLNSHGTNNQTPKKGKNLKKGKHKDWDMISGLNFTFLFFVLRFFLGDWLFVPWLIRNQKSALISIMS